MPPFLQSVLQPHGVEASAVLPLAWVLFVGGGAVFAVVMLLAAWAVWGGRRGWLAERRTVVFGGIAFPAVVLLALLVYSLLASSRMHSALHGAPPALRIEVVGEQWWWRIHYLGGDGKLDFAAANEIHIPVGETVELALRSADVLHSLWVPALAGKLDMVPGKINRLRLRADRAGVFRGQCAEYCGGPHAQMAFFVVAVERPRFDAWAAAQRAPAAASNPQFEARCAACHAVRGTPAAGVLGPDLTHVGSRLSLGAGILPNNVGTAAAWIATSQHLKPGNLMPAFDA
ncbi:MAG: c-type cytochrome, partial [Burkholderiaceae bacterium]